MSIGAKPRKGGQAAFEPTIQLRERVRALSAVGMPQDEIAATIGITKPTLHKYFKAELTLSGAQATAAIASRLYAKAMAGDTACMIFWLKCKGRWRETDPPNGSGDQADDARSIAEKLAQIGREMEKSNSGNSTKASDQLVGTPPLPQGPAGLPE